MWLALLLAAVGLLVGAGYVAGERYAARDWLGWFQAQKGRLVGAEELERRPLPEGGLRLLRLADDRGLAVTIQVKEPPPDGQAHPVLVALGGVQRGGRTAELLPQTGRFILVAVDYPYEGRRRGLSGWEFATALPAMRRAVLETMPAVMLVLDYLYRRADVDRERIVLAGGSFGALLAPAAAAAEPRISALAVLFGAGDLERLIAANIEVPAPFERQVAWLANLIVSPVEPLKYLHRVAPRPVLLINGRGDPRMPEALGRRLQEQARDPKTVVWFDIGHATIRSTEFRGLVVGAFADWLVGTGMLSPGEAQALRPPAEERPEPPERPGSR